jgi:nucleoside-diphosphate-sugar epimerase
VRTSWDDGFGSHLRNNVLSTQNLLEACTHTGCGRFVLASSSSVYGRRTDRTPMREEDPLRPYSPYAVTKASAEQLCRTYLDNHGLPTVILRYFTVYGPRQRPDMAFRRFIRRILDGEPVSVFGDGEQTRDYTYVEDAVNGTMLAAHAAPGNVMNLGSGRPVTLNAVLDVIGDILGAFERIAPGEQPGDVPHTLADISVAGRLGYVPATDLREGLEAQVGWQRAR